MEILPFLYLGSAYHASRKDMLDMLGITALINVSANCPNHFEDSFLYKSIPVEDNHKADISSWFNEAIEFIGEFFLPQLPPAPFFLRTFLWHHDLNLKKKKFPPKLNQLAPQRLPRTMVVTSSPPPRHKKKGDVPIFINELRGSSSGLDP